MFVKKSEVRPPKLPRKPSCFSTALCSLSNSLHLPQFPKSSRCGATVRGIEPRSSCKPQVDSSGLSGGRRLPGHSDCACFIDCARAFFPSFTRTKQRLVGLVSPCSRLKGPEKHRQTGISRRWTRGLRCNQRRWCAECFERWDRDDVRTVWRDGTLFSHVFCEAPLLRLP